MTGRRLAVWLTVVAVAVALAWWAAGRRQTRGELERPPLFPALAASADRVAAVTVRGRGQVTELRRDGERWRIVTRDGYPADATRVRALVVGLAALRLLEPKTALPELYPRLGVEDPQAPQARSLLVRLADGDDRPLAELIVGRRATSRALAGSAGLYVRRPGERQSWLVQGSVEVSPDPVWWMRRTLVDIPSRQVSRLELVHPDGGQVRLERPAKGEPLVLEDMPQGMVLRSQTLLGSLASVLDDLRFDDVRAARQGQWPAAPERARVTTADGLVVTIEGAMIDDTPWVRFTFEALPTATEAARKRAAALTAATGGWEYALPEFKWQLITRRMDDLVKPAPERVPVQDPDADASAASASPPAVGAGPAPRSETQRAKASAGKGGL